MLRTNAESFTASRTGLSECHNCHHWCQPTGPNPTLVIVLFCARRPIRALQPRAAGFLIVFLCPLNKHTQGLYPGESEPKRHSPSMGQQRWLNTNFSSTPSFPLEPLGWDKRRKEGREIKIKTRQKKRQATLLSQEVLSNPLQVVYFNQVKKA